MTGRILKIGIGDTTINNLAGERSAILTINSQHIKGAGNARCFTSHHKKRSWQCSGTMLFNVTQFSKLFDAINNGTQLKFTFSGGYSGNVFIDKLSIQSSVNSLVLCEVSMIGNGELSVTQ